ncbi:hypothetical protein B0H14DRAFT_2763756, partial [Mycena olivaceomarginata]
GGASMAHRCVGYNRLCSASRSFGVVSGMPLCALRSRARFRPSCIVDWRFAQLSMSPCRASGSRGSVSGLTGSLNADCHGDVVGDHPVERSCAPPAVLASPCSPRSSISVIRSAFSPAGTPSLRLAPRLTARPAQRPPVALGTLASGSRSLSGCRSCRRGWWCGSVVGRSASGQ